MKYLVFVIAMIFAASVASSANGDLIVNGNLSVGTGGIKFPDGSTQTTAIPEHEHSGPNDGGILKHSGVMAYHNSTQTFVGRVTEQALIFNSEIFDDLNVHSTSSNTDQFIVPSGYNYVSGVCQLRGSVPASPLNFKLSIYKNGTSFTPVNIATTLYDPATSMRGVQVVLPFMPVAAGDIITCQLDNYNATQTITTTSVGVFINLQFWK